MDSTLTFDPDPALDAITLADEDVNLAGAEATISLLTSRIRAPRRELRYRGLTMDLTTGAVRWQGERIALGASERALLEILLTHAGQFVNAKQLAAKLGLSAQATERAIEARIIALRSALEHAGSRCLPHKA
ncbi:MAG TPA: winged helix-turn-helix domain-containing protein, partial [Ktedonobacterales bacterium]|nr:winged helix-turn-helix domain-containing protein [Ktedonobacterales bacterium]